jgi:hypothetical protein
MIAEDYNTFVSCNQSQTNTVLGFPVSVNVRNTVLGFSVSVNVKKTVQGFSVSEFRVHDIGAPNFPQTWEEEGYTCMEDVFTSSEEKRQNTKLLLKKYIEPQT